MTTSVTASAAALPDWLAHRAATAPERAALVASGRSWTFAELDADASRAARQLATLGARAGGRVATLLPNGAAPAILAHAVRRLGAALVPLNVRLGAAELAWQLGDARPDVLVADPRTAALAGDALQAARIGSVSGGAIQRGAIQGDPIRGGPTDGADPSLTITALAVDGPVLGAVGEANVALRLAHDPGDVLAILYTSGTTGRPKGAMLTVGNFWWSAVGSALNLGAQPDDRWLACLPLFHVGGLSIVLRTAIYGATAVVHDAFDPAAVNQAIDADGVTLVSVVAVMLQRMLDAREADGGGRAYPPALRAVLLGGGPAPAPLLERCAAEGVPVVQTYGLTETCSQIATLAPGDALRKLGSAGRALYPNALRVVAGVRDAAADEAGEIVVRGPVVMAGYAGRPDETARAVVDGWLHTGDVGRLDAEGFLYVLDRRDDLIITGGENVYPAEVEAAILAHPWVAEAGVVGALDDVWGERVVAVVRLTDDAGPVETVPDVLRAHCRARLAGYKVPAEVRVAGEPLPRTASGKLQRAALRAEVRREVRTDGTDAA
ncbi:MAG TPA: o-succinylbenzoate--CoA ligase [Gemmatirosa sp.]